MKALFASVTCALLASAALAQPALTIYNQNFAVVRERLALDLQAGDNTVSFPGATRLLESDSVVLRDPEGKAQFRVLEQSYRADTLSSGFLLSQYEGKELDFIVRDQDGREHLVHGKVVRSGYAPGAEQPETPIVEVDGKLRFSLPGEPVFPALSDEGVLKPTLTWRIGAEQAEKFTAELGYVTGGFSWQAAYNFVTPEKGDTLDVVGWVTIANQSGQTFKDAVIKLMAGDVNRVQQDKPVIMAAAAESRGFLLKNPDVTEKAFDEFHLYSLPLPVTLHDRETKQVEFMRATHIKAPVIYVYDEWKNATKIAVMREFKNNEANGLGMALPKGRARFYRQDDADKRIEFVGEDTIDHTPKDEMLKIKTGDAFDLTAERTNTDNKSNSFNRQAEQAFSIKLRNHKASAVTIRVVEHLRGPNWEVIEKSDDFTKKDAQTIEFNVPVKPDEERAVSYRVRYDWK
jgi:hypothetical protein